MPPYFQHGELSLPLPCGETIIHESIVKLLAYKDHGLTAAEAALRLGEELGSAGSDPIRGVDKIGVRTHLSALIIRRGQFY